LAVWIKICTVLLDLSLFENQSSFKWTGKYFLIALDKNSNVVAVYPGSSTAKAGMRSRWSGYDNVIANARLGTPPSEAFASSNYMQLLLKAGYTFHIRPVLRIEHSGARLLQM
jgi:hypothetical protein